jgi:hypothetical protein
MLIRTDPFRELDRLPQQLSGQQRVLVAAWCRSVGTSWTLELHRLDSGLTSGTVVDWISSGVPISQPEPDALTRPLLAERGLHLFQDPAAQPGTQHRHRVGYVSANAELIALAELARDHASKAEMHPVALATQWIAAGFSAKAAAGWIHRGILSPQVAQQLMASSDVTVAPRQASTTSRSRRPRGTTAPPNRRHRRCSCYRAL